MNIKKGIAIIAAFAISLTNLLNTIQVSSADIVDNGTCGDLKWSLDSNGVLTFTGEGEMDSPDVTFDTFGESDILSQLNDYNDVYSYKKYAENITKVVISEGATAIGFCAFYKIPNLETVTLPLSINEFKGIKYASATTINGPLNFSVASYAFAECTSLKNITLSEGISNLGAYTFYGCTSLENVIIPSSIETWGPYSFAKCSKLKDITLQTGLTKIGPYAFYDTAVENIVIPKTINFFNGGLSLANSNKKDSNSHINGAFNNCKELSSVIFEDGIEDISYASFHNCPLLKKVTIPSSVTNMQYAFAGCTSIEEVYIDDSVVITTNNGRNPNFDCSFSGCENLKILEVPEGIELGYTNAGWNTNCNSLENLYLHGKSYKAAAIPICNDLFKFHCYADSTVYNSTFIPNDRKVNIEETISTTWNNLKNTLDKAESLNENDYTPESYQALKESLEEANQFNESTTSILPMKWATEDITAAINNLVAYNASYTSVDEAIAKADKLDLSKYTDESVKALQEAINAVEKDLDITDQDKVDAFAKAIEDAIKGLVEKKSNTSNNNSNKPNQTVSPKNNKKTNPNTNKVNVPKPAKVKSVKLTAKKKKLNVKWKKVSKATGYEVMYAKNNKFTKGKKTVKVKKNKVTLKRLKSKKKYFVKVRAYKTVNGNTSYGKWSKVVKKKAK